MRAAVGRVAMERGRGGGSAAVAGKIETDDAAGGLQGGAHVAEVEDRPAPRVKFAVDSGSRVDSQGRGGIDKSRENRVTK